MRFSAMPSRDLPDVTTLRFAPSPNGFLHLGHAYSALMNERAAAALNGRLLLRFEDLDRSRSRARYESAIEEDLLWLGLRFADPPRRQSEHGADYLAALNRLAAAGFSYPCFCSRSEVARAAKTYDPDGAPVYPGTCRSLPVQESAARIAQGQRAVRRLDMARACAAVPAALEWTEYGEGFAPSRRAAEPALWGDIVLFGRNGAATYHLAVTVDDALQRITDVVRGRDLLAATSVHRLLQELLGLPTPRYRHHRLVLAPDGGKLSKSRQSPSLAELRERGVTPKEIRAAVGSGVGMKGGLGIMLS
jgi:glutamyl-Q tRNA(Asp) synthetase